MEARFIAGSTPVPALTLVAETEDEALLLRVFVNGPGFKGIGRALDVTCVTYEEGGKVPSVSLAWQLLPVKKNDENDDAP